MLDAASAVSEGEFAFGLMKPMGLRHYMWPRISESWWVVWADPQCHLPTPILHFALPALCPKLAFLLHPGPGALPPDSGYPHLTMLGQSTHFFHAVSCHCGSQEAVALLGGCLAWAEGLPSATCVVTCVRVIPGHLLTHLCFCF